MQYLMRGGGVGRARLSAADDDDRDGDGDVCVCVECGFGGVIARGECEYVCGGRAYASRVFGDYIGVLTAGVCMRWLLLMVRILWK